MKRIMVMRITLICAGFVILTSARATRALPVDTTDIRSLIKWDTFSNLYDTDNIVRKVSKHDLSKEYPLQQNNDVASDLEVLKNIQTYAGNVIDPETPAPQVRKVFKRALSDDKEIGKD